MPGRSTNSMKMKKTLVIIIALLIIISGCKFSELRDKIPGLPKKVIIPGRVDSTKGVEAEIVRPTEEGKVYSNQLFNVIVKVSNEGESKAVGETCVFGSFSECECQEFRLEGKRKLEGESLEGEDETLTFDGGSITKEDIGEVSYFVTAKTRYNYKTYGIIKACIKKDPYSEEGCKTSGSIPKSTSSAPLGIVKVTEEIIPETDETVNLVFNIELKESGEGDLYSLNEDKSQCKTPEGIKQNIDVKLINAPGRAYCDSTELKKGEAGVQCRVNNVKAFDESYESEITLEIEYAYETIDTNKFEVV